MALTNTGATNGQGRILMEILEPNHATIEKVEHDWDMWLIFDSRPRILERGHDFTEDTSTLKRHLITEASRRGYDIATKALFGDRLLFQVFSPDGAYPKLPDTPDARKKYPWEQWFDGRNHKLVAGTDFDTDVSSMRAYIYKMASQRGLKVTVSRSLKSGSPHLVVQAYTGEKP